MEGIAYLLSEKYEQNEIGYPVPQIDKKEIFVSEKSITRSEWRAAGKFGLNPSVVLVTPLINYTGEKKIEYNGKTYGIYRTYSNGEEIELYLETKAGI